MNYFLLSGVLVGATMELLLLLARSTTATRRLSELRSRGRHGALLPTPGQTWITAGMSLVGILMMLGMLVWLRGMVGASAAMSVLVAIFWVELYGLVLGWSPDGRRAWTLLFHHGAAVIPRRRESVHPTRAEVEQVATSILRSMYLPNLDKQLVTSGLGARSIGRAPVEARH